MEQDLHHPSPRIPEGWKRFQADNIDVTTTSDMPTHATTNAGRHSRSPSVLSNHSGYIIQASHIQNNGHNYSNTNNDSIYNPNSANSAIQNTGDFDSAQYRSEIERQDIFTRSSSSAEDFEFNNPEMTPSNMTLSGDAYFRFDDTAAMSTATTGPGAATLNQHHNANDPSAPSNSNIDDFYISSTDPSSSFINSNPFDTSTSATSPPIVQDNLSPFAPYHNSFDQQQQNSFGQQYEVPSNNTLGLHWTHHRNRSDQSDISSNPAASPYIGSVHSEHGSPYIGPQPDTTLDDDLREAILGLDIEMGAPYMPATEYQNSHPMFDASNLSMDAGGFPRDAPLFPSEHPEQQYYDQQQPQQQQTSRPTSSSSYHRPSYPQSIFSTSHPSHISTSIPPSFQSPPLASAASIPEIEVTVAPPTPRSQAFNNFDEYLPHSYRHYQQQHQRTGSAHNSPSIAPTYLLNNQQQDVAPLSLPSSVSGRRRAVSETGIRPPMMMAPSNSTTLTRRVSSGSHPYLGVRESPSTSGRSTPSRIMGHHRKSFSHGSHNMTAREVLELVKNEGPREAKNPKKFVCDYPGCEQRFTRNSNKT
jgi:hypothetical protein